MRSVIRDARYVMYLCVSFLLYPCKSQKEACYSFGSNQAVFPLLITSLLIVYALCAIISSLSYAVIRKTETDGHLR